MQQSFMTLFTAHSFSCQKAEICTTVENKVVVMAESNIYQKGNFVQTLSNIEEGLPAMCFSSPNNMLFNPILETPFEPMEFLSRSWSNSSIEVMQALSPNSQEKNQSMIAKPFSITAPSASPQHATNEKCITPTDQSPLIPKEDFDMGKFTSHEEFSSTPWKSDNLKTWLWMQQTIHPELNLGRRLHKKLFPKNMTSIKSLVQSASLKKWLKDTKDKKKEELRLHNAQVHAALSVAGLAAALAAVAEAKISENSQSKTDVAVASAAALVAAQCVEVAESMGADRNRLSSVISSAVSVKSPGDILTLTAAAATSLRGATTLQLRPKKEYHEWSNSSIIPFERDVISTPTSFISRDALIDGNDAEFCNNKTLLAKGTELLIHVPNGRSLWRVVSIFLNTNAQVIMKIRNKYSVGAFTKAKESIILEVQSWPRRGLTQGGAQLRCLSLKTCHGIVELEFKNCVEHQVWAFTVSQLISLSSQIKEK